LNIEVTQNPDPDDLQSISMGLQSHNAKFIGEGAFEDEFRFSVFAKDDTGKVVGGLRAAAAWNWLNIEVIWVSEKARGVGLGQRLLARAEEFAMKSGFFSVYLETASFQAREFYEKQGYAVFGKLDDYPIGHVMYYMKKRLTDS
jgi:ribosomal protein S18 acetylase RimI-like enzyme